MLVYIIAAAILFLGVILRQGAAFYWIGSVSYTHLDDDGCLKTR